MSTHERSPLNAFAMPFATAMACFSVWDLSSQSALA